jgi:hypothetical protein
LVLKLFAHLGDGWTVQTHRRKVMSVKFVSRTDHGMITTEPVNRLCRSARSLTPLRNPQHRRADVIQITIIL